MAIDLQLNYPILDFQREQVVRLLTDIAANDPVLLELPLYGGSAESRAIAAQWMSRPGYDIPKASVAICMGGHHAVMVVLLAAELRGKKIAIDPLTYGNFKIQAETLGIELLPCDGDADGMTPGALANAARAGARAVYLMPTVHNPLGTVMPEARRREICALADEHDLLILDDDAYNFCEAEPPPSFAAIAPKRAFTVYSFTKPFAPLLKIAYLAYPTQFADRIVPIVKVTSSGASALLAEAASRLIQSGAMSDLLAAKRLEGLARQQFVTETFAGLKVQAHPTSFHFWIHLPADRPAAPIVDALERDGILVSGPDGYRATVAVRANGIRVAMGAVRDKGVLRSALERVRERLNHQ